MARAAEVRMGRRWLMETVQAGKCVLNPMYLELFFLEDSLGALWDPADEGVEG